MKKITILGPLPPWKWVSQYVDWFVEGLWKKIDTQVIDFKSMYPDALYPWWSTKQAWVGIPKYKWVNSEQLLVRWNPISWIIWGMRISWDILHIQYWIWFFSPMCIIIAILAKCRGKKVVITIHNVQAHEKSKRKLFLDCMLYSFWDELIVHSKDNKSQLMKIMSKSKIIHILPHWIITPKVKKIEKSDAKSILGISEWDQVLLIFGNIRPYKWLKIWLEAFKLLIEEHKEYTLIIAWKCREDWSTYQNIIDDYNISENIIRIEWFLDDRQVSQVFSASDLMILPYTHFDAQSGVVALSLWYELPIIVSDLWWLTAVINEDEYVFAVDSPSEIKEIILNFDAKRSQEYIINRKTFFQRDFIVDKYLECIKK